MKQLILSAIIALSMISNASAATPVMQHIEDTTVIVYSTVTESFLDPDAPNIDPETEATCTGFVIATEGTYEDILTAGHCAGSEPLNFLGTAIGLETITPAYVQFFNGDIGTVQHIVKSKDTADITLLQVHSMRKHPSTMPSVKPMSLLQSLYVFGLPEGYGWALATARPMQGSMRTKSDNGDTNLYSLLECTGCDHGDSGAGVFDTQGKVVGMLVEGDSHGKVLVIPSATILDWLQAYLMEPDHVGSL